MEAWKKGHSNRHNQQCVSGPQNCPEPPVRYASGLEDEHVNERECPTIQQMNYEAEYFRFFPVRGDHSAKQKRDIHAGKPQALAGGQPG